MEQFVIEGGPMAKGKKVSVVKMPVKNIRLGRNSRLDIKDVELAGLMQSIREEGLLQPIGVVERAKNDYEVAYGNRRFLACDKLGFTHIPCVVHYLTKESDVDMKNLTENIQRRNISLTEAGRYIELLKGHGLTPGEVAVRLGVDRAYVAACENAYKDVPQEFQKDLEVRVGKGAIRKGKKLAGKISIATARKIINLSKEGRVTKSHAKELFKMAKQDDFSPAMVDRYAAALIQGKTPEEVEKIKTINCQIHVSESEYERLKRKYVDEGNFRSVTEVCRAILSGKKSEHIRVLDTYKN